MMREISEIDLKLLSEVDINTINKMHLVDIRNITIDKEMSVNDRINEFLKQIKNPYCYKIGDTIVKIKFSNTNVTMEQQLEGYFNSL